MVQPIANPSSPSVRFTALDVPTITSTKKTKVNQLMFAIAGAFTKGTYSARACTSYNGSVRNKAGVSVARIIWKKRLIWTWMPEDLFLVILRDIMVDPGCQG